MIVLKRKKIRLMILTVFVFVLGVAIFNDKKESVPTVSLPVSGKTIVLDARTWKARWGGSLTALNKIKQLTF